MLYDTALHCTALHCTTLCCITLYCTASHCTTLHHTALRCMALHCITLHYTAPHTTTLHHTALHCTALHCTTKHCTALHSTLLHYCIAFLNKSMHHAAHSPSVCPVSAAGALLSVCGTSTTDPGTPSQKTPVQLWSVKPHSGAVDRRIRLLRSEERRVGKECW